MLSPPSRVEWIEIPMESVMDDCSLSPPSRVEWIEISPAAEYTALQAVSAFAGGVD